MKAREQLPGHEQAAAFWVGALIATEAIAVYIEPDKSDGPFPSPYEFERLPTPLKISILAACEGAFRRRRERLLQDLQTGDRLPAADAAP